MRVSIITKDGVRQICRINAENLEKMQQKYGDKLEIVPIGIAARL